MMSRLFCAFLALVIAFPAYADLRSCTALHAKGPSVLGGFELVSSGSLEKRRPGDGLIRVYHGPNGSKASVNYYAAGHRSITDRVFRKEFVEQACNMLEYAYDRAHTFDNLNVIRPSSKARVFQAMAQGYESNGFAQFIVMGRANNCVIKVRLQSQGTVSKGRPVLRKMVMEVLEAL